MQPPFAVIFDADGVLLDSERQSYQALLIAIEQASGGRVPFVGDQMAFLAGRDDASILESLRAHHDVSVDPAEFAKIKMNAYRRVIDEDPISVAPGVIDLLDALDAGNIPYAVATSAVREKLDLSLRSIGLSDRFTIVVTADDVSSAKPDPALFLLAAEKLGIRPGRIIVFEDTINGIEAANRAGMFSVAVVGTFPRESFDRARQCVDSLKVVNIQILEKWIDGES